MLQLLAVRKKITRKEGKKEERNQNEKKERIPNTGPGPATENSAQLCRVKLKVHHKKLHGSVQLLFLDFDPSGHKNLSSHNISYFQCVPNILKLLLSTKQSNKKSTVLPLQY